MRAGARIARDEQRIGVKHKEKEKKYRTRIVGGNADKRLNTKLSRSSERCKGMANEDAETSTPSPLKRSGEGSGGKEFSSRVDSLGTKKLSLMVGKKRMLVGLIRRPVDLEENGTQ